METKFTKGEWCIFNDRVGVIDKSNNQSHGMMSEVAYVDMYNFGECEGEANANLMATAPEMYKEIELDIKNLRSILMDLDPTSLESAATEKKIARKEKLLAKARGE